MENKFCIQHITAATSVIIYRICPLLMDDMPSLKTILSTVLSPLFSFTFDHFCDLKTLSSLPTSLTYFISSQDTHFFLIFISFTMGQTYPQTDAHYLQQHYYGLFTPFSQRHRQMHTKNHYYKCIFSIHLRFLSRHDDSCTQRTTAVFLYFLLQWRFFVHVICSKTMIGQTCVLLCVIFLVWPMKIEIHKFRQSTYKCNGQTN